MSSVSVADTIVQPGETAVKSTMKPASAKSTAMKPAGVKSTGMKAAGVKSTGVKPTGVKPAGVKSTGMKAAGMKPAMKAAKSAAVEPPAAVGRGMGEVWLTKRCSAKQCSCEDCQRFSDPRSGSSFS
jgi:hypothetical protein